MRNWGLTYYTGSCLDVSARVQGEQSLKLSEERFRLSQTHSGIGTWDWDIETGALYWSAGVRPLFGLGADVPVSYETFYAAIHPEDAALHDAALLATIDRDEPYEVEHRIVRPDGTIVWVAERGGVLRDAEGKAVRMIGVVYDITPKN
jgi:PAS domain S-box-containing protein